jgi:Winged helix DNA-binding domain
VTAHLLPIYDEYLVAYRDRAAVPNATLPRGSAVTFQHALVIDGQVAGTWRMKNFAMTITPVRRLTGRERKAARHAASRYARFLEAEISVSCCLSESRQRRRSRSRLTSSHTTSDFGG